MYGPLKSLNIRPPNPKNPHLGQALARFMTSAACAAARQGLGNTPLLGEQMVGHPYTKRSSQAPTTGCAALLLLGAPTTTTIVHHHAPPPPPLTLGFAPLLCFTGAGGSRPLPAKERGWMRAEVDAACKLTLDARTYAAMKPQILYDRAHLAHTCPRVSVVVEELVRQSGAGTRLVSVPAAPAVPAGPSKPAPKPAQPGAKGGKAGNRQASSKQRSEAAPRSPDQIRSGGAVGAGEVLSAVISIKGSDEVSGQ